MAEAHLHGLHRRITIIGMVLEEHVIADYKAISQNQGWRHGTCVNLNCTTCLFRCNVL